MTNEVDDLDSHKLMYHPERVSEWKQNGDCFPIYVEIGPTNRCNHKCVFCALDWIVHKGYDLDKDVMLKTLEDMAFLGVKSIMFAGEGEPLLHKDIDLFVKHAHESGLDVAITTNGVLFDEKRVETILPYLSWMRFSVNAATSESYSKIHETTQGDFNRVIKNLKNISKAKREKKLPVDIGIQTLLISPNLTEIESLARISKEAGADNFQVKPYSHHPESKNDFSVNYSATQYLEERLKKLQDEHFRISYRKQTMERLKKPRTYKECYASPFFALITAKGEIIPCNLFYNNPEFVYGNINEQSFGDIWKSERRKEVLEKIRQRGLDKCREGCRLDADNIYLDRIRHPHPRDNYI